MESRKGESVAESLLSPSSHCPTDQVLLFCQPDEEATIKVASAKNPSKSKSSGIIKLKKALPKLNKPGLWKEASVLDGESLRAPFLFRTGLSRGMFQS